MNEHSLPMAEERYSALSLIRRLLTEQGLVHWRKYAIAFTLMAVAAGCTAFSAYLIGDVINQAYVNRSLPGIIVIGAITVVLFSMKGLATYGHSVMLSRIGNRIVADNQRAVFSKLLNEGLGFFSDRHSTEFIARLSTGAAAATQVINLLITSVGRDLLSLIGLVTVMVVQDPVLSFFSFVVAPPALFVLRKLIRRIYSIARTQFQGGTRIIETLQETLQGIRIVKAFTLEDIMRERFDRNVAAVEHEANKMARVSNRASPLMETLGGCAIAIAITYGGYRVIETGATPGQFFSFITAFLLAYEPAKRLARLNIELNSALVGVRVLFEVIDSPPSEAPDGNKPDLQTTTARLEFKDVHFAYRAEEAVLRGMSFVAEAGKLTALVGPSGGGKSTVFNLLLRFYENERGLITIDGQDISKVSRRSLRQHIAYVGQEVFLFRGTIRENIAFRKTGCQRGRDRRRRQGGLCPRFHPVISARIRDPGRRARPATVRGAAATGRHCTRAHQKCADHPARRGDCCARLGIRTAGTRGHGTSLPGPHDTGDRAPAAHGIACRQDLCRGGRARGRVRPPRRIAPQGRPLCILLQAAAQDTGAG